LVITARPCPSPEAAKSALVRIALTAACTAPRALPGS
jgi:hypothetical protein